MKEPLSAIKPLKEDSALPYVSSIKSHGLKIRWIHGQCFEIRLPDGKTLITDPWFSDKFDFNADMLDGCDYITVNHAHFDHFQAIPEIFKRFTPTIICDGMFARELSNVFHIEAGYIFPVVVGQNYEFASFHLESSHGTHNFLPGGWADIDGISPKRGRPMENMPGYSRLDSCGCLFNTNWMFVLPNNYRIGFAAGTDMINLQEVWRHKGANLLLHQRMCYTTADEYVQEIETLKGDIVIPMHHDASFDYNADMNVFISDVNKKLQAHGTPAVALNPKRFQWYTISTSMEISNN